MTASIPLHFLSRLKYNTTNRAVCQYQIIKTSQFRQKLSLGAVKLLQNKYNVQIAVACADFVDKFAAVAVFWQNYVVPQLV